MNATQEINGKLYEQVPTTTGGSCNGCAFLTTKYTCGLLGSDISCTEPRWVIFVPVRPDIKEEPDEQCGVGNG